MKNSILIFLAAATYALAANTFYPVPIRDELKQYVAFGKELYVFQLPSMNLNHRETYSKIISNAPTSISGSTLYFTKTSGGDFEINTSTFSLTESGRTVPDGQPSTGRLTFADNRQCVTSAGTSYCFVGGTPATVTKTVNGQLTSTLSLNRNLEFSRFVRIDTAAGILHVTGYTAEGRGSDAFTYFQIALSTFTIAHGPVSLEHTANSGCPVEPRSCGVDVLLYMDANNGVLSYVSSFAVSSTTGGDSTYQITVTSRSFPCGNSSAVFDDVNRKAPTIHSGSCGSTSTTSTPPTGTSTCPSNCGTNPCCNDIRLGNTCYSTKTHHCVNNVPSGAKVLCSVTDKACGGYCYDTTMYGCRTDGTLYHL